MKYLWGFGLIGIFTLGLSACFLDGETNPSDSEPPYTKVISHDPNLPNAPKRVAVRRERKADEPVSTGQGAESAPRPIPVL